MSSPVSSLLSVADADRLLAPFHGVSVPVETVPLLQAAGRILREDIRADRAYPAQDRSRMDGIALRGDDLPTLTSSSCPVAGLSRAGDARLGAPPRGACMEIMTGAALPHECDTVVPYEDIVLEHGVARLRVGYEASKLRAGQNVHRAGSDCAAGAVLVPSGARLNAAHLSIAASVGLSAVPVAARPRVVIVATGDELVGVDQIPLEHQLRMSNAYGLAALFAPCAEASIHHCGDDPEDLTTLLKNVLAVSDLVLVSGGVSAGKFDLVPDALESLGVRKVFHKLAQKPGKPLWFGTSERGSSPLPWGEGPGVRLVFGLPGNPVSSLVCARRFVLPLLWARLGWSASSPRPVPLAADVPGPSRLTRYLPVRLVARPRVGQADPVPGGDPENPQNPFGKPPETVWETVPEPLAVNGSGDFATLGHSDGFLELPPTEKHYPAGAQMAFFAWSP